MARATGHASANAVEEFAQATEELVAELTEKHAKQIEALSKAMQQLTAAISGNSNAVNIPRATPTPPSTTPKTVAQLTKTQKWAERCKNATTCPHCSKIHPNRTHDQCWHLKKNAAKRPAGWTAAGGANST